VRWLILLCPFFLFPTSIVLIHLGPEIPQYLTTCVEQVRVFNPDVPIYLLGNERALARIPKTLPVIFIAVESLSKSSSHQLFLRRNHLDKNFLRGFWLYTTERFFYLYELMKKFELKDVVHVENDIMIYFDLKEALPVFQKNYSNQIAATFDNDDRCIAGFLYISNLEPIKALTNFIAQRIHLGGNDMELLSQFKNAHFQTAMDYLPILMPAYAQDHPLESLSHHRTSTPERFSNHFDEFQSIFDAAALGQYLGGVDPIHTSQPTIGFVNESALFNVADFQFEWVLDNQGRAVPYALYKDQKYRINNLHIHSKNLRSFLSKHQGLP